MTDRNGLFAFEMLSNLDDEVIAAATLPETGSAVAGKPSRKEREPGPFARFMDSGWAAAIISVTVALAVLVGIVAAGRMGTADPPGKKPSHGMVGSQSSEMEEATTAAPATKRPDVNSIVRDPAITVTIGKQSLTPLGMVTSWFEAAPGGGVIITEKGTDAIDRLDEVQHRLDCVTSYIGGAMLITLPKDSILTSVIIYDEAMERVVRDKRTAITPELPVGEYLVEVGIRHQRADGTGEHVDYLFRMTVADNSFEDTLYITAGMNSYATTGYPIHKTYYDVDLGEMVQESLPGASANLEALFDELPLVILLQNERFYLTPLGDTWEFLSLTLYDHACEELYTYTDETYRSEFPKLDLYDYWVVATYRITDGIYETDVEFPFRLAIHEKTVDTSEPNIDTAPETEGPVEWGTGSIWEPSTTPRIMLKGSKTTLIFENRWNGYMLWSEEWYDGGMICGDGIGATGQLADLLDEGALSGYNLVHTVNTPLDLTLREEEDTLVAVTVYDKDLNCLGEATNFTVIHELPEGTYIVVLAVTTVGDYIPEADASERYCTEYAFVLELYS